MTSTSKSGHSAATGYYWNFVTGDTRQVRTDADLPKKKEGRYLHIPAFVMLLLSPLLGLAFVMFLPLIGIFIMLSTIAQAIFRGVTGRGKKTPADDDELSPLVPAESLAREEAADDASIPPSTATEMLAPPGPNSGNHPQGPARG